MQQSYTSKIYIAILIIISVITFSYSVSKFSSEKEDIIIYLSDVLDDVAFPFRILKLGMEEPDRDLLIPIKDLPKSGIEDTWGSVRENNRTHEGVDIFAKRGTPVFSGTSGFVLRVGQSNLGGNYVFVRGKGGVRYYYAHLDKIAEGAERGMEVTTDTVLGFVGNTGNAETTPPHLHFGMYKNGAQNPYDLLATR